MEQKYYIVKSSLDSKLIGSSFPQAYSFTKEYNPDAPHALFDLYECLSGWKFPDYTPNLDGIKMSGKAKLTDIVSGGFDGQLMIISPRVKAIVEKYNLCPHRFYEMGLYFRKMKYDYYMFHIQCDFSDFVDYERSTFAEFHGYLTKGAPLDINSKEEFFTQKKIIKERDIMESITADILVMNSDFCKMELDYFYVALIGTQNDYISERLMNQLLDAGVTGWDFVPANNLIVR